MQSYLILFFFMSSGIFHQGICDEEDPLKPLYQAQLMCIPECHNLVQAQVVAELSHRFVTGKTSSRCSKLEKKKCLREAESSINQSWENTESDCKWLQGSDYFNNTERGMCSVKALTMPIVLQRTEEVLKAFVDISENYKQNPITLTASCLENQEGEKECNTIKNCKWCPFTSFFTVPTMGKGICVPDDTKKQKESGLSFCSLVNAGKSTLKTPFQLNHPYSLVRPFYKQSKKALKKTLSPHVLSLDELVQLDNIYEDENEEEEMLLNGTGSKFPRNLPLDDPKEEPDSVLYIKQIIDSFFSI